MRHSNTTSPKVNAGSMADIAFLLLIFFLVTTTITTDAGISRKLPKDCPPGIDCTNTIHERNILRVILNNEQGILVDEKQILITELKDYAKAFIDNNGDASCLYCKGNKDLKSSDNPQKAVISLQTSRETNYELFINVQDELTKAYYELRTSYAKSKFNKSIDLLTNDEMNEIKKAYPFIISEANTK
ncbi:ExbD/TolR family protein [Corallibacter sp.]|uniref:ExbD/TolR family protein n=1 Tax=Corallibacter sp. TaxID=2038084 RepID=UPI003AB8EB76